MLNGAATSMHSTSRSRKLEMIHEYLMDHRDVQYVVFGDATDVIVNPVTPADAVRALSHHGSRLVASAEPSCFVGKVCSTPIAQAVRAAVSRNFREPFFVCSGLSHPRVLCSVSDTRLACTRRRVTRRGTPSE